MSKKYPGQDYFQQAEAQYILYQDVNALRLFEKSAEEKYPLAYVRLTRMHLNGRGVNISEEKSKEWEAKVKDNIQWIKTQAASGNPQAQDCLGVCYDKGVGIGKDRKEALTLYTKASNHENGGMGIIHLAYYHVEERDLKQAVECYRKAEQQGIAEGVFGLGECLETGRGIEQDEKLAVDYYKKAAEKGHAYAQYNLGLCHAKGKYVRKNDNEAVKCYQKAAEAGIADAQAAVGLRYLMGNGVLKNIKLAIYWLTKAAERGVMIAQYNLALYYSTQPGAENRKQAFTWFTVAAKLGHGQSQLKLAKLDMENASSEAVRYEEAAGEKCAEVALLKLDPSDQKSSMELTPVRKSVVTSQTGLFGAPKTKPKEKTSLCSPCLIL